MLPTYSIAQFKLHAREYILTSANTFSPSSQLMLASKGSMLSSKGNMLSCMILFAIEIDTRVQLVARIWHCAVSRCTRARLHALVHYFTHNLNLMLVDITRQAFIKCLLVILIHELFVMVSGKRGTVAEISNAQAKSLSTHDLCHIFARQIS